MRVSIFDEINPESFYMGFEEPENDGWNFDLKILEEIEKHQAEEEINN